MPPIFDKSSDKKEVNSFSAFNFAIYIYQQPDLEELIIL